MEVWMLLGHDGGNAIQLGLVRSVGPSGTHKHPSMKMVRKVHNQCHDRLFLETEPFYHRRLSNKKAIHLSLVLIGLVV